MKQTPMKIQARSLDQAIVKAAGALGTTQDNIEYEIIRQGGSNGLLSIFGRSKVEISAWTKPVGNGASNAGSRKESTRPERRTQKSADRRPERRAAETQPVEDSIPLTDEQVAELRAEVRKFCEEICSRVSGTDVKVADELDDGRLILNIDDEFIAGQITKNGKLAEALEHILRKKPRHLRQELPFRIFVDAQGIRMNRESELVQMAHDLSEKVHENKRPIVLNYKSSYDRKIIHMALDKDERVYTKSIGAGANRKLMILPVKNEQTVES
jgi:spoIIIJ-associated protein